MTVFEKGIVFTAGSSCSVTSKSASYVSHSEAQPYQKSRFRHSSSSIHQCAEWAQIQEKLNRIWLL